MKKSNLSTVILLFSATIALSFACSKSSYNDTGGGTAPENPVYMRGSVFSVPNLTLFAGSKVTWINDDNMVHTVTANDASFNSGDINPGGSFSYTFNSTGTYNYHCTHHAGMTAVVTIVIR
ncbi:MAG TPA: plastocyanin/azurin family copper-binding protein [Chitinophagaceae bacterium]|nr:plastocyanin/azurin family copper-binding protein [Chitinophagaceae bacterium]